MNLFIRKKAYNLLDRYDVLDDTGRLAYTADGLLVRFKGFLVVRDRAGIELLALKKKSEPALCQLYAYSLRGRGKSPGDDGAAV